MGAGHDHGTAAVRAGSRHRSRLWFVFALLGVLMVVEAVAAWFTGSLALLSDAAHMFTDVLGIGMALAAITAAGRFAATQRTFGLYRLEVLAALANAVLLAGVAVFVLVEAIRRFAHPPEVLAVPMLIVAVLGFLANVVALRLLRDGARESLNVKGAYLEVFGDLLASVGVIVAALVLWLTGWPYADPIIALGVGVFILPRTFALARAAVRVLVQAAPPHLDVDAVRHSLAGVPGVADVHDLHVWTLTSGMDVASAHLSITTSADLSPVLTGARRMLREAYGIEHATLQVEPVAAADECREANW